MAEYHEKIIRNARYLDGITTYYVDILCDTAADIPDPAEHPEWEVGSELVVLENGGSKYQLSNAREWVQVNFNSGGGGDGMAQAMLDGVIEKTVTDIVSYASTVPEAFFKGYSTLKTVSFPKAESVADEAFLGCVSLEHINFPKTVSIGNSAFNGCKGLAEIEFPNVTSVASGAFAGCTNLKTASLKSATSVGSGMFLNCSSLEKIVLTSLTTLGTNMNNLPSVKLLDFTNIESMSGGALWNYSSLETLILRGSTVCTVDSQFAPSSGISSGSCYIYVPKNLIDSYKTAENWGTYANQFRAIEDYPEICG